MILHRNPIQLALIFALALALPAIASAQLVQLKFGDIVLGSETTTLVENGDFETNGGNNSVANGWGVFGGQLLVTSDNVGGLIPDYDAGDFVAKADVTPPAANGGYFRSVTGLAPNTEYVLSAYIWNLGDPNDSTRQWNVNVDLNDVATDPQLRVLGTDVDGGQGYFVYNTFNTTDTGTGVTLRVFYDFPGATTTGWPQQPVGAMWDRISITEASTFVAPVPEPGSLAICSVFGIAALCRRRKR